MKDDDKTKKELINELKELRQRIGGLETLEARRKPVEDGLPQRNEESRPVISCRTPEEMAEFLPRKPRGRAAVAGRNAQSLVPPKALRSPGHAAAVLSIVLCVLFMKLLALPAMASQQEWSANEPQIVYGGDHNYPPYEWLNDRGRPVGFHIDLLQAIGEVMGFDVTFQLGPWDQVRKALEEGRIDVIAMFYSEERDQLVDFSEPHTILYHKIFVRRDAQPIRSLDELRGRKVIVQRYAFMQDYLRQHDVGAQLVLAETEPDAIRLLASGKHDCALVTRIGGQLAIQKYKLSNLTTTGSPLLPCEYCLAVTEGNTQLLDQLNEGLAILKASGRYDQLYDKWFGGLLPRGLRLGEALRYAAWVLVPLALLAAAAMACSWFLKKQVTQRTHDLQLELAERKRVQEKLKFLSSVVEQSSEGMAVSDLDGNLLYVNKAWVEMHDYKSVEELIGKHLKVFHTREQLERDVIPSNQIVKERGFHIGEVGHIRKDGTPFPTMMTTTLLKDENGKPIAIAGIAKDITERKLAEKERIRLMTAIEQSAECITITDSEGTILYVNPAFERITGYSRQEAIGQKSSILKSGKHDQVFYQQLWDTIKRGEIWTGRFTNRKKDGSLYEDEATISPVRDSSGNIVNYVGVKRDVTREVQLEAHLLQTQKLEAIGQLAGGVAHDFNNILQAILGHTEFAISRISSQDEPYEDLRQIKNATEKAAALTKMLLAFGRRQVLQPLDLNLNEAIVGITEMLERIIEENIELDIIPGHNLGIVFVDPRQIEQVLINLCVNARDAMPNGGKITIETENVVINSKYCKTHPWAKPGHYVLLSVTDTGVGMEREVIQHIFDPFFTTKEVGKGTGLGLATVYGIIKQHQGMIQVYSEIKKGTTFKIYFPIVKRRARDIGKKITGPARGGKETILVAEDDEMVRQVAVRILQDAGYTVLSASDGQEAMKVFKRHADQIALVLADVVMPRLSGRAIYDRIKAIKPQIRFLFSTGYSANVIHTEFILKRGLDLIQKPYNPEDLLRTVRELIDKTP